MKINFGGHDFFLHHAGALYWPQEGMLVVADLHLEKGSHYAGRGYFLPPYDSQRTLSSLLEICKDTDCRQIMLLGDSFHDPGGYDRLGKTGRDIFDSLKSYNPIWIRGNHDGDFVPEGFSPQDSYQRQNIIFHHQAVRGAAFEISGHFHPKFTTTYKGSYVSSPCFVKNSEKIILPAFGAYAGGLDVTDPGFQKLFNSAPGFYLLGRDKVLPIG